MTRTLLLLCLTGCAYLQPESVWLVEKQRRLDGCQSRQSITTRSAAKRCLGRYAKHRGSPVCTDAAAWMSRVERGIP